MSGAESILVGAVVLAAVVYLVRRAWNYFAARRAGGCCGKCPVTRPGAIRP
ncbi:MAG: FeoB-associated Cys-rich membrane protein [Chthoniobacterales bacterium]